MALAQEIASFNVTNIAALLDQAKVSLDLSASGGGLSLDVQVDVGLGGILDSLEDLPVDGAALEAAIRETLAKLQELAAIPEIRSTAQIKDAFQQIAAMLQLAAQRAADPDQLVAQISGGTAGLPQILDDVVGRFLTSLNVDLPDEIKVPFEGLEMLAAGELDATQLADFLVRFLIGIDLQSLQASSLTIDAAVDAMLSIGGDLGPLTAHMVSLTVDIRATVKMLHIAQPDVPAILVALAGIRVRIDALFAELEPALLRLAVAFESFDAAGLALRLEAAFAPFMKLVPNVSVDLDAATVAPLRALDQQIAAMTEADLDSLFAEVEAQLQAALASSGIGNLDELLEKYRLLLIDRIRSIRLGRFRDEIVGALSSAEARISQFGIDEADQFFTLLGQLQAQIDGFDTAAVGNAVTVARDQVAAILQTIDLDALAAQVTDKLVPLGTMVQTFIGEVDKIQQQLDALTAQVEAMDFAAAADEARRIMGEIRSAVEVVLALPVLPDAARLAIAAAARPLQKVNLRIDVGATISEALGQFDPEALLAPIQPVLAQLRAALQKVVPAAIVAELDPPFVEALATLERYRPGPLLAAADAQFAKATQLLDAIDPRPLVVPLQGDFAEVVTALRAKANPDPIFLPLETLYAKIVAGLDGVDAEKLMAVIAEKVAEIPAQLGERLQSAVEEQAGNAATVIAAPEPFRFGDLIRPFSLLLQEIRTRIGTLPETAISGALTAVAAPLAGVSAILDPDDGYLARLAAAIDARVALLVSDSGTGPMADLMMALHELEVTVAAQAQLSASVQLEPAGGAASVQLDARLELTAELRARLDLSVVTLREKLAPPSLVALLRRASEAVEELVPEAWLEFDVEATVQEQLDLLFAGLDLTATADELDAIGARIQAKLATMAAALARGIVRVIGVVIGAIEGVMPDGLAPKLRTFMDAVRAEIATLDPAPIKAEMNRLLDSIVHVLERFSPAAIAARLGAVLDTLKAKLETLKPSAIAGPVVAELEGFLDQFAQRRPSLLFAALVTQTEELQANLDKLLDLKLGGALLDAVVRLRGTIEIAIDDLVVEFESLVALLESSGETNASVSISLQAT
jgi:uncharacterized coiled-coil protein SlyX